VDVQDTGFGIPSADLPFIFNRFYRVRSGNNSKEEGNGLGLAIVKSIVEGHGGQVSVESEVDKGTCFSFTLPLMQQETLATSSHPKVKF
jgi:signal transduction histidine kinase